MNLKLRARAWADIAAHYGKITRAAWSHRKELDSVKRSREECEFLPGALAVQETPPHPAPRITAWIIVSTVFSGLLWLCLGHIDIVASAQGKVAYVEGTKVVQPLETAVVRRIFVQNGQTVEKGAPLVQLDDSGPKADLEHARAQLSIADLDARRGRILLAAITSGTAPAFTDESSALRDTVVTYHDEYARKSAKLKANAERAEAEIVSLQGQIEGLEKSVPLHRTRVSQMRQLAEAKAIAPHELVDRELAFEDAEDRLRTARNHLVESRASLESARAEYESYRAEFRRTTADSMNQAEANGRALRQEILKQEARILAAHITAPVKGTVQQLAIHTEGGVVSPAQPILQVVPGAGGLTLEVMVENKDAGFVRQGQRASVKVAAFPYTKYGLLHGHVTNISGDAVQDEKSGLLLFPAQVTLDSCVVQTEKGPVNLSPGMAVTADIQTGNRRLIEYFLSPVLECLDKSFSER